MIGSSPQQAPHPDAELRRLRQRVRQLEQSVGWQRGYGAELGRDRFVDSPIPMTDEDWSGAKRIVERLQAEGVTDFVQHVREHPGLLAQLAPAVKILDANPAAVRIYQASSREELLDALNAPPDLETYNPTTGLSDIFVELIDRFSRGETRVELEGPDTTLSGTVIYIRTTTSISRDRQGDWGRVLQTVEDFTLRKAAEEHLRQAQRMDAIGQLTGGLAHDFNNLLAIIMGHAERLANAGSAAEPDPSLQSIMRAAERGAELTQRLLAYARKQPLRPRSIDVTALTRDMADHLLKRTLGKSIEIEVVERSDLWRATADPGQLETALLNLAINAQHAMPDGGRLTFDSRNVTCNAADGDDECPGGAPSDSGTAQAKSAGSDFLCLAVRDTGVGMSPEVAEQAFEPFFTTREVGEGSGLGLSMVYGFAKQSGGHAVIQSEPGAGTTVEIYLPRSRERPAEPRRDPDSSPPRGRGERVLVVEDDAEVRQMTEQSLLDLGYGVVAVADAGAARAVLVADESIELVLTDVVLSGDTSGPALAIEAQARDPALRVVFMSGYPTEEARRSGFLGSDTRLLRKPFDRQALANALHTALATG